MKVGVLSDTHGNVENLRLAIRHLLTRKTDLFVHLGDDFEDAETFDEFDIDSVIKVPGVYDPEYSDQSVPHRLLENLAGFRVMFSHTPASHPNDFPDDLRPEDSLARGEIDILLHGHTHVPRISVVDRILHLNPGHLREDDKKGHPPTFGILEIIDEEVSARILDLASQEVIASTEFKKS
jgi:putative phosphoesterase